jgi:RND superfamily putative drug exporter
LLIFARQNVDDNILLPLPNLVSQFRWPVLIIWLAAAVMLTAIAPAPDRTPGETTDLLPSDTPVHLALDKLAAHFGDKSGLSAIVIVFERKSSSLAPQDLSDVERVAALIAHPLPGESIDAELQSISIRSPTMLAIAGHANPLISNDGHAALIWVSLPYNYITKPAARLVRHAQQILAQYALPPGMSAAVTGSAGYGYDYAIATESSHRKTMVVTIVSVVLILLVVYRAPVAAAIPLASISLAAAVVFQLLALLAPLGLHCGMAEQIFTFVLLYGAGVDYSLLFIGRYREFLEDQTTAGDAIRLAVRATLPAVAWSAVMTISGVAMLCFARFSVFHNAGPSMILGVFIAALAATTLTPALLAIIGPKAFWPTRFATSARMPARQRFWPPIARVVVAHPGWVMLLTLAVLVPPAIQGLRVQWNYDALFSLKSTYPSRQGTEIIERHWPTGEIAPITVLLVSKEPISADAWTQGASRIISELTAVPDVADIRALPQPLGLRTSAVENAAIQLLDRERILAEFLSADRCAMRLSVVLNVPPLSRSAIDAAALIRETAAHAAAQSNLAASVDLTGATAETIDVRNTTQQDFLRVAGLALAAVFVVVALLLRDLLISAFILSATLLSYLTAVGLAYWFFRAQGATGLEWKVQMLLFIVLVAVGQDYSIFFAVRLAQESRRSSLVEATKRALISTGPVISSCGLIMAATLGSVMAGDIRTLVQLGFAFVLGMLIDTFLVRPLLLPAFTILTRRTLHRAAIEFHGHARAHEVFAEAVR